MNWWSCANGSPNWKWRTLSTSGRRRHCGSHNRSTLPSFERLYMTNAPGHARLIGIIILARFLKLPLTRYEAVIEKVESSPMFTQLWPDIISTNLFPRAQVLEPAGSLTPNAIGQLRKDEEGFCVSYRHPGLAREYLIDEEGLGRWRQSQSLSAAEEEEILALRRQLRLINTRNRLTHMILMGIAEHQGDYLASEDALQLRPLSQVALAEWIRGEAQGDGGFLPPGSKMELVDNSMISRLRRNVSVLSPQGQDIPLRDFLPSTHDVHKRLIEAILDEEKEQIRRGDIERAYTDEEIKERLKERFGVSISRRTVSACRQSMRVPSSYTRNSHCTYPPRLAHFSFHYSLNVASVRANAPEAPGVYEISLAEVEVDYPLCSSGVVYIGRARNLRKRLRDHLRPGSKNGDLKDLLRDHQAVFRYIVKHRGIRAEEKMLCQCFILAYGALPRCNHIRP
jgi:RNA polymerase sigma-54 factor